MSNPISRFIDTVPNRYKGVVTRALSTENKSRVDAIKAKCLSCSNFQLEEITQCTVIICPLHPVRPYQTSDEE